MVEGRGLLPSDDADSPPVMVVNRALAEALWGDRSPVGEDMIYPLGRVTIVCVAEDVKQATLEVEPPLAFYVPFAQHQRSTVSFAVRTETGATEILPAMREAVWRIDGELAIISEGGLEDAIWASADEERFRTLLMAVFSILATVLAAVGIMGVTARQVSHRTRELGIRKALGAHDDTLLGEVIGSATVTGAIGVGIGLLGAFWTSPILASFLYGVESFDLPTYSAVGVLFLLLAMLASYLPGRKLLKVNPVEVLKAE